MTEKRVPIDKDMMSPLVVRATEMADELRGYSARNQAIALSKLRTASPQLCAEVIRLMKTPLE